MSQTIEGVFDGTVFRPRSDVNLEPNTPVEITVTVKSPAKEFRVKSKHLEQDKIWITTKRANCWSRSKVSANDYAGREYRFVCI